jgi:hypothetical protein
VLLPYILVDVPSLGSVAPSFRSASSGTGKVSPHFSPTTRAGWLPNERMYLRPHLGQLFG